MFERRILLLLGALFFGGASAGLFTGLAPIYSVEILGWEKDVYSGWVSQSNLVAGVLGLLLFGFINFGSMGASASLGWLDGLGGIPAMFVTMAVCGLIAATLAFAAKVGR